MSNAKRRVLPGPVVLLAAFLLGACALHPKAPAEFAEYPRGVFSGPSMRAVSPDGVHFSVRCEKNKPHAEMTYWREAMKTRMSQAGYRILEDTTCAMQGRPASLLKLAAPYGNQDYVYWIAFSLNPSGSKILVAEAAGESKSFLARQKAIEMAIAESGW